MEMAGRIEVPCNLESTGSVDVGDGQMEVDNSIRAINVNVDKILRTGPRISFVGAAAGI